MNTKTSFEPRYFKIGDPCVICKKQVKCRCFNEEVEFEDKKGSIQAGELNFCSLKCHQKYAYENNGDAPEGHSFDCKILGEMKPEYVKLLQEEISDLNNQQFKREKWFWEKFQSVCPHKELYDQDALDQFFQCSECRKTFKVIPKDSSVIPYYARLRFQRLISDISPKGILEKLKKRKVRKNQGSVRNR